MHIDAYRCIYPKSTTCSGCCDVQSDTSGEELQTEMIENFANGVPWPFMGQVLNSNTQTTLRGYLSSYAGFYSQGNC